MKSTNPYRSARYRWRANQRAAKARRRIEGHEAAPQISMGKVCRPRLAAHLWTITIQHRDGSRAILHSDETPSGLTISPSLMGRKIMVAMTLYRQNGEKF